MSAAPNHWTLGAAHHLRWAAEILDREGLTIRSISWALEWHIACAMRRANSPRCCPRMRSLVWSVRNRLRAILRSLWRDLNSRQLCA